MLIMDQKDDDTHLCLRCSRTIVGLENYVTHRQQHCLGIPTPQESKEKDLSADVPQSCVVAPLSSSPTQSLSWDVPLTASDFFNCLELQSTVSAPRADMSPGIPSQQFSCSPKALRDSVLGLPPGTTSMNCPSFDDVEECDQGFFSECETNSNEYYPPRTYTGGKWKPGSRPHLRNRQQWGVHSSQSAICEMEQNIKQGMVQICNNDSVTDPMNFECRLSEKNPHAENIFACTTSTSPEVQSSSFPNNQVGDSTNMLNANTKYFSGETFKCNYCKEVCPGEFTYMLHLFSSKHRAQFVDIKDYYAEIFTHESILIHSALFQCRVCSFYSNNIENFLSHMKGIEHSENIGTQEKLICLPWKFRFEKSEEIAEELHNNFKKKTLTSHPIIVLKNEVPLFCSFCFGKCQYVHISKKRLQLLSQKRTSGKNTTKHKSFKQRKFKRCMFCGRRFLSKEYKKHRKTCSRKSQLNKREGPKNVTEREHSNMNFSHDDPLAGISGNAISMSDLCDKVKAITVDNCLATELCEQIPCTETATSCNDNDTQLNKPKQNEKPFDCSDCKKQFSDKMSLLKHKKFHSGRQMHRCLKCDFRAVKRSLLRRHEEIHSVNRPRPFVCEICGSAQLYKWALMQHMRLHSEGTFKCDTAGCQRVCRTRTELTLHKRVHTNERPYHCNLCAYNARTAHQLKKHQRTHTGDRPFKCKHCSYSASLSHQLLRHMRVHTGSKPYKCPYCDYVCNNQENIRKHILKTKKHEGQKMYPCTFCSFGCNDFPEFQKHLLCSHKEYFPKGLKDVDSSVVAGLYKRDFPRREPMKECLTTSESP